jgi:DeoR/GlpR family transcriptional regulator of sugar metabolism
MTTKSNYTKGYFAAQGTRLEEAKRKIAEHAVSAYLAPGDSIVIDAGTSLWPIASAIAGPGKTELSYSVMTHNYTAFEKLQDRAKGGELNLFLAGGRYDDDLKAFFGDQTYRAYESFGPRKVFIGVSGLSAGSGLRCRGNTEELQVKELISKLPTQHRIIIADFTKFGNTDALKFASPSDLTIATLEQADGYSDFKVPATIVTDKPNEADYNDYKKWLEGRGTHENAIPKFEYMQQIFDLEVQNFKDFGITIDIVD